MGVINQAKAMMKDALQKVSGGVKCGPWKAGSAAEGTVKLKRVMAWKGVCLSARVCVERR